MNNIVPLNQVSAVFNLQLLSYDKKHSIILEGSEGVGKTFLAKYYADLLSIKDFQLVEPKVQLIREAIVACYEINTPVVICIENLDIGVIAASHTLLKFLEEPSENVYIIITCRNIKYIPDTIISRSSVINVPPPTESDLDWYGNLVDEFKYEKIKDKPIWKCSKTFTDVVDILALTSTQVEYFDSICAALESRKSISDLMWTLQKYSDSVATPIKLVIRYIMYISNSQRVWNIGHECLKDLEVGRISTHAIVAKFVMDYKYKQ